MTHERAFKSKRLTALAVMFVLTAATQPELQPQPLPDVRCQDDRGVDRCAGDQQRRMRELYGVRAIEDHAAADDEVRRAFYVDGYGRDVILISFVRPAIGEPIALVHFPRDGRAVPPEPLQASMPEDVWEDMLWRSQLLDRELLPPSLPPDTIRVCLHPWLYVVETADPPGGSSDPPKTFRTGSNGCDNRMAAWYALEMQRAALRLFPACARLDPEQHRGAAAQLAACRLLRGERMAAAAVMNRLRALGRFPGPGDYRDARGLFAPGAVVDWIGRRHSGELGADIFWIERMGENHHPTFHADSVEGLSATRVRVIGRFHRSVEAAAEANSDAYWAPVEIVWILNPRNGFQVESLTVGAWSTEGSQQTR